MNVLNQLQTSLKCGAIMNVLYKLLSSNVIIMGCTLLNIG